MKIITILSLITSILFLTNVSRAQLASYCTGPVIIMEAEGEVESVPDTAEVTITVKTENEDATIALAELASSIQNVINVLEKLEIEDEDVRTDTVNIFPVYEGGRYGGGPNQQIVGYSGTSFVYFETRDMKNIAEVMNNVMIESENLFSNIEYSSSKNELLKAEAREIAYKKAFTKANHYAELTGNKLGNICTITEGNIDDVTNLYGRSGNVRSMAFATLAQSYSEIPNIPIKPGMIKTMAKVSIVYQLEN